MARRWLRFSLRTLLVLIALAGLASLFGKWGYQSYRWRHNRNEMVHEALFQRILNGSTRGYVDQTVGYGRLLVGADATPVIRLLTKYPQAAPEGIETRDEFVRYPLGNEEHSAGVTLQFRKGRLINHELSDFADPYETVAVAPL